MGPSISLYVLEVLLSSLATVVPVPDCGPCSSSQWLISAWTWTCIITETPAGVLASWFNTSWWQLALLAVESLLSPYLSRRRCPALLPGISYHSKYNFLPKVYCRFLKCQIISNISMWLKALEMMLISSRTEPSFTSHGNSNLFTKEVWLLQYPKRRLCKKTMLFCFIMDASVADEP